MHLFAIVKSTTTTTVLSCRPDTTFFNVEVATEDWNLDIFSVAFKQ